MIPITFDKVAELASDPMSFVALKLEIHTPWGKVTNGEGVDHFMVFADMADRRGWAMGQIG